MKSMEEMILNAIDNRFKIWEKKLKYDQTYYGKIRNITDTKCVVSINGVDYSARIKEGVSIIVNDVVIVKIPNGNFSFMYVDGKLK